MHSEPDAVVLDDADALSFLSLMSPRYADYFGLAQTRRKVTFTLGKSTGKAKLRSPNGKQESVKVAQVAQVLAPNGEATATCKGDGLTLKTERLTLDLQQ